MRPVDVAAAAAVAAAIALATTASADAPEAIAAAVAAIPGCADVPLAPSAGGWVAVCGTEPTRIYFARRRGGRAVVTRLIEHAGAVDYDVRPTSVHASYRAPGGEVERSWDLGDRPALPGEIRRGEPVCSAAQIAAGANWVAKQLAGALRTPTWTVDFVHHRATAERQVLACGGGITRFASRTGLVIPIGAGEPAGPALDVGLRGDVVSGPAPRPGALGFRVAARPGADRKQLRLVLRVTDRTADPIAHGDPRTGDHVELWFPPAGDEPSCDRVAQLAATCSEPPPAAPIKLWIARGGDGRPAVASEPAGAAADAVIGGDPSGRTADLTIDLSGALAAGADRGLAVLLHDGRTGATLGTANPTTGGYSPLADPGALDAPPMPETIAP